MEGREPTRGTKIAALEAQRNELDVRAQGALLGERRAALARFAMLGVLGIVQALRSGPKNWVQTAVGATFAISAVTTLLVLRRVKKSTPRRALWIPLVLTTVDFGFSTVLACLDVWWNGTFNAGQHAIITSILMSFSVARLTVWHVGYALVCAEISYTIASSYGGVFETHASLFIMACYAVIAFMFAMTNRAVGNMFQDLRRRDNLTRFLPRQVAERVLAAGPNALAPVQREVTVLFSDIRGFTGMSEGLEPVAVLTMLDDYFGRMSQIVKGHDGVVGKFMGDGLLAYWGVPDRLDNHAALAVKAARDMRRAVCELNDHRAQHGLVPIKIGIGIHTGTVAAGMLGGSLQAEYTVIGDAVNVASRIEGLTKDHAVDLLLSETTYAQLGDVAATRLASAEIRGRKAPIVLYTITPDTAAEPPPLANVATPHAAR